MRVDPSALRELPAPRATVQPAVSPFCPLFPTSSPTSSPTSLPAASRAIPAATPSPPGAVQVSVLDGLPAGALRVGDARWFTGRPDAFNPPLAFYARLEGRAPSYYELETQLLSEADLLRVLAVTDDIVALQLPVRGMTPAVLQVLQNKTGKLECLQLSGQECVGTCVNPLIETVAPHLKAFSLGGAGGDDFARVPGSVGHVLGTMAGMPQLEYLDISGLGTASHVSVESLQAVLAGRCLRGLSVAGCSSLDVASLLSCAELEALEYLDARGTAVKRSLRHWHASDRLMHKLEANPYWRCLLLPKDFLPRQPERLVALQEAAGMQYLHCRETLVNLYVDAPQPMGGGARCGEASAGQCEQFLHACAALDADLANVGRWMPIPRDRWDALAVRKKGAVYVLTEVQALRGQGYDVQLQDVELTPSRNAYGESCYVLTFTDTARHQVRVTLMESELDDAIGHRFVARLAQQRGGLSSVAISSAQFRALRGAAQQSDAALHWALKTLPM